MVSRRVRANARRNRDPAASARSEEFWAAQQAATDVVIDFSDASALPLLERASRRGIRVVSAISHYASDQVEVLNRLASRVAVLHSANITIGINCLLVASKLLRQMIPEADVEIIEQHFREKQGVSGTALKLADALEIDRSSHVSSIRVGGIVGKHEIIFGLPNQTIRLIHESISRSAFGRGAVFAAKWLIDKPSGLYSMEEVIRSRMQSS